MRRSTHNKEEAEAELRLRDFVIHWFERAIEEREYQKSHSRVSVCVNDNQTCIG